MFFVKVGLGTGFFAGEFQINCSSRRFTERWDRTKHCSANRNEQAFGKLNGFGADNNFGRGGFYFGQFKNGRRHGLGVFFSVSGEIHQEGIFENGDLKQSQRTNFLRIWVIK